MHIYAAEHQTKVVKHDIDKGISSFGVRSGSHRSRNSEHGNVTLFVVNKKEVERSVVA